MKHTKQESLAKASKELMLKEPFYGLFLIGLNKLWSKRVPTAGVSKHNINFQLAINEEFWESLSPEHHIGLLKHELLHIAFFHLTMHDDFADKKLANVAMDLEINQYIDKMYLPDGGCTIDNEMFAPMNLPPKAGCRVYYDLLQQQLDQGNGTSDFEKMMKAMGQGQPTYGDGNPVPDHSTWDEFNDLSEAEKKLVQKQVEHQLKEIAEQVEKSRGHVPGELKGLLDKLNSKEPPKFDWKAYLRRFTGGSQKVFTKKLRRKFNKRFEDNPGLKIKHRKHILVAVDTSGSVSDKEVQEFFHEIGHINKTGAEITVVQCDTHIRHIGPYKAGDKIEIHGRGGTYFDPVLELYNDSQDKYTCLIYLTDGECDCSVKPRGKMLWVISTRGSINKDLPGPQIKLN
jgi:predicted metal-dependent peptidase